MKSRTARGRRSKRGKGRAPKGVCPKGTASDPLSQLTGGPLLVPPRVHACNFKYLDLMRCPALTIDFLDPLSGLLMNLIRGKRPQPLGDSHIRRFHVVHIN